MATKPKTKKPARSTSMRWYENNKDDYNERRRERYARDQKYRNRLLKEKRKRARLGKVKPRLRWIGDTQVKLWTTGAVASVVDCAAHTLRLWEAAGIIPLPTIRNAHRLYTEHQVGIIKTIFKLMRGQSHANMTAETKAILKELHAKWEN